MTALPALYISHGSPMLALESAPSRRFMEGLGATLARPRAIVVASAHYESPVVRVDASPRPRTIHDFGGFPDALYQMQYPAPGDPALAADIVARLTAAGIPAMADTAWGFDHGTWMPLRLIYPDAEIPVVAMSVDPDAGPAHHHALGRALAPLRDDGVLLVGSGSFTHNLMELPRPRRLDHPVPDWVTDFTEWTAAAIEAGRTEDLLDYRARAPHGARNHPRDEHFLPLFFALGAGGSGPGRRLHASYDYGVLAMAAFAFG